MNITVVCGLLGAGKTSFIRNFARNLSGRVVVLVNDFGSAGIDGEIFSAGGIESVELPSGCVCCTLRYDLITTVTKIVKEWAPDHLVIEPSGVASPSAVLEALEDAGAGRASVVGVVDAAEFTEIQDAGMYGSFFEDQIKNSDVILVNKTDIADAEKINETIRRIEMINPRAIVLRTVNAEVREAFLPLLARKRHADELIASRGQDDRFRFETLTFRLSKAARLDALSGFFHDLAAERFGSVARAKALIQTEEGPYRFDVVFGKVDAVRFEQDIGESRVVVIGEGLDKEAIERVLLGGTA